MRILFLNTAGNPNFLAVCTEDETLALIGLNGREDGAVIPKIEHILRGAGLTYTDLTHLACTNGPGGFTGLRIGVTTVNILAHSLDLPSAGVHLSELWHSRVKSNKPYLWLHSTQRNRLFVKGFEANKKSTPTALMDINEARALKGNYTGELMEAHKEALANCHPMPDSELFKPEKSLPALLAGLQYNRQILVPWYGRPA